MPVITIKGPGEFRIVLGDQLALNTIANGAAKPLIKVSGGAVVELMSQGGYMGCKKEGVSKYAALLVESGSTVEITEGNTAKDFIINGVIWNEGTLVVKKNTKEVVVDNGAVVNYGKMQVGIFDEKASTGSGAGAA